MAGTCLKLMLRVNYDGDTMFHQPMHPGGYPKSARHSPEQHALLDRDRRKRGEHRPRRLLLGVAHPTPYCFHSTKLPGAGLPFPDGDLCRHLSLELWVDSPQPLWHYGVLFHFKGSEPRIHPFGKRVQWVAQPHWTLAERFARLITEHDESPCGCCVRVRVRFEPLRPDDMLAIVNSKC